MVEATLAVEIAVEEFEAALEVKPALAEATAAVFPTEAALDALSRLDRAEAWLPMLLIDIMILCDRRVRDYRPAFEQLELARSAPQ